MTESTTPATTPAPTRRRRRVQGPPGVPCPSCHKLAAAQDEGEIESYTADVSGDALSAVVEVSAELYLSTECCGEQFKYYSLEASMTIDHECPVEDTIQKETEAWEAHLADESRECTCDELAPDSECEFKEAFDRLEEAKEKMDNDGESWTLEDDGEDGAEAYQRSETSKTLKSGKVVPINYRYARSYRGITTECTIKHDACEEEETVAFGEGDLESPAGAFEVV